MVRCIMGVDCGFVAMGVVILDVATVRIIDAFSIMTKPVAKKWQIRKSDADAARCEVLANGLRNAIELYRPEAMFVELPHSGAKSSRASHSMGMSKGIIVSVAQLMGVPTAYLLPSDSRKAVCGKLKAAKEEIAARVIAEFPNTKWPETSGAAEHCYDAAAVLIAARADALYKMCTGGVEKGRA